MLKNQLIIIFPLFVINKTYSVEECVKEAFQCININEYTDYIEIDPELKRPSEVPYLRGLSHKAKRRLDWEPKIDFKGLVKRMVQYDIQSCDRRNKSHGCTK